MACPGVRAEKLSSQRLSSPVQVGAAAARKTGKRGVSFIPTTCLERWTGTGENDENPRATKSSANLTFDKCCPGAIQRC